MLWTIAGLLLAWFVASLVVGVAIGKMFYHRYTAAEVAAKERRIEMGMRTTMARPGTAPAQVRVSDMTVGHADVDPSRDGIRRNQI